MKIGYARVSTPEQKTDRQTDILKQNNCERIYQDKTSGASMERPELVKMLDALREGDTVIICELARLSRSVKDLFSLVDEIHKKGAEIKSLKEPWLDTTTPQGKLLFSIFAGISQFERDIIRQRISEGISSARARGRVGGRPKADERKISLARELYRNGERSVSEILKITGLSRSTFYQYMKKEKYPEKD